MVVLEELLFEVKLKYEGLLNLDVKFSVLLFGSLLQKVG